MTAPIIERDPALPIAHCTIGFDLGSLVDPEGKEGATALLFRLLRRSVANMTPPEIERRLATLGASASVDVARSISSFDGTCLSRNFQPFMEVLVGMLQGNVDQKGEFERLKGEALSEWADSLDNDAQIARRFFVRKVFEGHPYGRLTGGTPSSIEKLTTADLLKVKNSLFTRERLVSCFAGDVDAAHIEATLIRLSDQLPAGQNLPKFEPPDPTGPAKIRLFFIDKPQRSQVQILIGGLGAHPSDPDRTARDLGKKRFGGTFSARLSHEVRVVRGWSYGAYSQLAHDRCRQSFSMWTFPQNSDAAACLKLQLELFSDFIERGITKRELSAARKYLLNSHAFALDTASKRASLALDQKIYHLPPSSTFKERVSAVTVEQVNAALRARLSAENLVIVVLGSKEDLLHQVQDAVAGLASSEVLPFDLRD